MHQQLRLRVAGGTNEGPGAMHASPAERDPIEIRPGEVATLLERIGHAGFNLRIVGGSSIEGPGELVLAVDDEQMDALYDELKGSYRVRRVEVQFRAIEDEAGKLAEFLRDLAQEGVFVNEIFVGAARGGMVPVQVTTIRRA
jgi:hypothetical protein